MRILMIGNSLTFFNDMPHLLQEMLEERDIPCEITMIAHSNWCLEQHTKEPDVRFNIKYGRYDYVVLQEYSHPFGPEARYYGAMRRLCGWIRRAGAVPVVYETCAPFAEPEAQEKITAACRFIAEETDALLAPVGELWAELAEEERKVFYYQDGHHPSKQGSRFAAEVLMETILIRVQE